MFRFFLKLTANVVLIGQDKVTPGPCLLVSNHISHFDPCFILACIRPRLDFMAMEELFINPYASWFFTYLDVFPVSRKKTDTRAIRTALKRLEMGRIVCVFPEGGLRSGKESVLEGAELKPGAAILAEMSGVPVRPFIFLGTDRYYSYRLGERIPLFFIVGDELKLNPALKGKQAREELNERIAQSFRELYAEVKQSPGFTDAVVPRTAQKRWEEARR
ncbi:MAG: lysophospholipid acyltransferase family protein [Blastochloris sp.]|nr:lysophospholipid acyltransferase family protein [Blastochloris sp.]